MDRSGEVIMERLSVLDSTIHQPLKEGGLFFDSK